MDRLHGAPGRSTRRTRVDIVDEGRDDRVERVHARRPGPRWAHRIGAIPWAGRTDFAVYREAWERTRDLQQAEDA